ncbi:tetratricopeptide repeat protein [Streptomyces virginiae]|uniref:tetratricopeptide repeat protein n=1 Tax=Streptomyces virginiae TaxID=1961 RepID=UPI00381D6547
MRRFEEAINALTRATALYRDAGDRHREGNALGNLGLALQEVRRFEEAVNAFAQATTIFREIGDRHGNSQARLA